MFGCFFDCQEYEIARSNDEDHASDDVDNHHLEVVGVGSGNVIVVVLVSVHIPPSASNGQTEDKKEDENDEQRMAVMG